MVEMCPICGETLKVQRVKVVAGWRVCSHHWVKIKPSPYESRCDGCMGWITLGEQILLSRDNAESQWVALHHRSRCDATMHLAENVPNGAWGALYLMPGAPPEVVKAAYRALAQLYHPDKGGDTARMQEINAAMEELVG